MLTMMNKDLRLLRPVLLTAAGLAVLFWVALPGANYFNQLRPAMSGTDQDRLNRLAANVVDGTTFLWISLPIIWATVGGMAFANERGERWGDFLGVLPISRRRVVVSKFVVAVGVCGLLGVLVLAGNIMALLAWERITSRTVGYSTPFEWLQIPICCVSLGVTLFGMAFLLSTLLRNSVYCTAISCGFLGGTYVWVVQLLESTSRSERAGMYAILNLTVVLIGMALTFGGVLVQNGRRSP